MIFKQASGFGKSRFAAVLYLYVASYNLDIVTRICAFGLP